MHSTQSSIHRPASRTFLQTGLLLGTSLLLLLSACGSDSSSSPTPVPPVTSTTAAQFNMGDAPADWLLSFTMKVSSLSLTKTTGDNYTVSSDPIAVEMMQRLGTMEPIGLAGVPQQTYSGAHVSIASCTFRYIDSTGNQVQKTLNGPFEASIPFSSSVTVGTTPFLFNFDLDLDHSLTTDGSGAFQFSPQFHHSIGLLSTDGSNQNGMGNGMNARYGGMYQMMGVVQGASSTGFSILPLQAAQLFNFKVNQATQFQGQVQEMAKLQNGMGVLVTAQLQSDGTLLATRVRATMSATGAAGGGIITAIDGPPATQFTMVMQNGAGASINTDYLSKTLTVNLTSNTQYEIDTDRVSLTGIPFVPTFDVNSMFKGQSVYAFSEDGIVANPTCDPTCGTITASTVRLREQGFRGTTDVAITPGTSGSFTLTLMPDCAFTALTGATQILVYQQTATNVEGQTAIAAGTTLRVHGLLFQNGGQWILVASTIASV